MFNLKDYKNIYMIGIGGISMSGLAHILISWNFCVSGSDQNTSKITDELISNGISDMHCRGTIYLTDELMLEYGIKHEKGYPEKWVHKF